MSVGRFVRSRFVVVPLALAAALVLAAACGDGGGGGQTPPADQTPAGETPTVAGTPTADETPTAGGTPTGGEAEAEIMMIPSLQFDKTSLTIAADADVTITVENADGGISHSFAVFTSEADAQAGEDPIGETEVCDAPCTETLTIKLAAGQYFFRCEVHPDLMTGTLIAQ